MSIDSELQTGEMRRRRQCEDIGSWFGKGRPWAERNTFQRVSRILDIAVIALLCAIVAFVLWWLFLSLA